MKLDFFPEGFSKNNKIPNCMEICLIGAEFLHADRQSDTAKQIVAFRNFAKGSSYTGR